MLRLQLSRSAVWSDAVERTATALAADLGVAGAARAMTPSGCRLRRAWWAPTCATVRLPFGAQLRLRRRRRVV